jgi:hypothetical protein
MKITSLLLTLAGALAALTFVTTEVQAAGPPGAAPLPAGNITATTAEISGRFTANGADTDIYLELSENGAPFKSFYAVSIEGPFVELLLPFTLTSLKANVRYTYRFRVSNAYGTNTSASLEFTTLALPDRSLVEATVPGDAIAASSANSPVGETAPKAIDNDVTTKYLNFDKLGAGFTVTPSGNKPVRALSLISANDEPARDPSSVIVEGSDDGVNFIPIASNAVPAFATRHYVQSIALPGMSQFNVYRVQFPTVSNAVAANSIQIAEVELLHHPEITSPSDSVSIALLGRQVSASDVHSLFDRQLDGANKLEVFFDIFFGVAETAVDIIPAAGPTVLKGFELIGADDDLSYPERRPSFVTVVGSNDGMFYSMVGGGILTAPTSNLQIQEFSTETNQTAWARYRVYFGPPVGGDRLQVGEMRLFGERPLARRAAPPTLAIRGSGASVLVSWPDTPGFNLETMSALQKGSWTAVGAAPVLSNGVNTVTLPKEGTGFFRLRK